MGRVPAVPRSEIAEQEREYQRQAELKPARRGPKKKLMCQVRYCLYIWESDSGPAGGADHRLLWSGMAGAPGIVEADDTTRSSAPR